MNEVHDVVDAVWKAESARIVAALTRVVRDLGTAEECAQDALVDALRQWPHEGVPDNPAAWITTAAKRRALDRIRREQRLEREHERIAHDLERAAPEEAGGPGGEPEDVLRLLFLTCHPELSVGERVALTLRLVTGLTDNEIGRALLTPERDIARRIASAKRTLAERGAALEPPGPEEVADRLPAVLDVISLVFNEGHTATAGPGLMRPRLCAEALRTGRMLAALVPDRAEAHALVALMELQRSRSAARIGPSGEPLRLHEQDRSRWDREGVRRGFAAMLRARDAGGPPGPYTLQAAIAVCHARAPDAEATDWGRIALLYDRLADLTPTPVVLLNRAVAVGFAHGPERGLESVEAVAAEPALRDYHLLPSVRGDLLARSGRPAEARVEFERAAALTDNSAEHAFLLRRAADLSAAPTGPLLGETVRAFLARDDLGEQAARSYGRTLHRLCRSLGEGLPLTDLTAERVAGVFAAAWGGAAARTWNRHRSAVRSFAARMDLAGIDAALERRAEPATAPAEIDPGAVRALCEGEGASVRERVLWCLLSESGVPARTALALNVEELDLDDRSAVVEGALVTWRSGTARLLPDLVGDRTRGPLFLSDRRPGPARTPGAEDLCPDTGRRRLSYERAERLFALASRAVDPHGRGGTLGLLSGISRAGRRGG
ncbi:DUF6596 domain-containing protein [Nocardiopsis lambiniae]|uniref:DUF6596 domain-containing protein n=1 Tax=Nocardiopsis lambiniae TaxID=3075539 RepID=A0ABU2M3P5_9ACTN|nr:DUF6596 domain-containing protein [Nocardiopsis sp. DSM 44743]MDT0327271.1 DUF6596 domain-containing protein [Nocardiopsis sp. DSM 44743]